MRISVCTRLLLMLTSLARLARSRMALSICRCVPSKSTLWAVVCWLLLSSRVAVVCVRSSVSALTICWTRLRRSRGWRADGLPGSALALTEFGVRPPRAIMLG